MASNAGIDPQERIIKLLEEILKWTRFEGLQRLKEVLTATLASDEDKRVYQFSDGRSSREVASASGLTFSQVVSRWRIWNTSGIVVPSKKYQGRFERIVSLEDLGIAVPLLKMKESRKEAEAKAESEELETKGD